MKSEKKRRKKWKGRGNNKTNKRKRYTRKEVEKIEWKTVALKRAIFKGQSQGGKIKKHRRKGGRWLKEE
jgi:hypothetical protein